MGWFRPATPGTVLALAAFALMLVVTLSTPIIKSLYLFQVNIEGQTLQFGVFGFCLSLTGTCVGPKLGYSLDDGDSLIQLAGRQINLPDVLIKGLTYALIVNPVASGLALIVTITGLFAHCGMQGFCSCCLGTSISVLAMIFVLLAIGLDLGVYFATKSRLSSALSTGQVAALNISNSVSLGTALWLSVAAAACLLLSIVAFSCSQAFGRRQRKTNDKNMADPEMSGNAYYQNRAREEALRAQQDREHGATLPKFAEYQVDAVRPYDASKPSVDDMEMTQDHSQGSLLPHEYDYEDGHGSAYSSRVPQRGQSQGQHYESNGYYAAGHDSPYRQPMELHGYGADAYEPEAEYHDAYDYDYGQSGAYDTYGQQYQSRAHYAHDMPAPVASVPLGRSAYETAQSSQRAYGDYRTPSATSQRAYDRTGSSRSYQRY